MKKITTTILLLALISSAKAVVIDVQQAAINDAKKAPPEVSMEYLQCYALNENDKSLCTAPLNRKHINPDWRHNEFYARKFRFYMEKLGFYNLTLKNGLKCDYVNEAPLFSEQENAYLLKCNSQQNYFLRFDYKQKRWKILP
ncbi:MAG: hypothetical protein DGJ47_000557 [Rickettsiaceae bacterium]